MSLAFGGSGGDGGSAHVVEVNSTGKIVTQGTSSNGIFAQSVGGGGGNGGFSAAAAGARIGALSLSLGGGAGNGGKSGKVSVDSTGDIATYGDQSNGVLAQSIGGGGGNGGIAVASVAHAQRAIAQRDARSRRRRR